MRRLVYRQFFIATRVSLLAPALMRPHILALSIVIFFSMAMSGFSQKKSQENSHQKWLEEEVAHIITPAEREVFSKLSTVREKNLFIQAFWKHRDPTPITTENEFKAEHYRRINHSNRYFGRGLPKPGGNTDRGRMYIILGEPNDIQRFEGKTQVYPTEVWFYQDLKSKGLPPGFYLVFFQSGGTGEYRLYSPLADGPQALLTSYTGSQGDYISAYNQLREVEPDLSEVSLTLIPGERPAARGRPSVSSDILVNKVESIAEKAVKDIYARKFLEYKDSVEVEYSTNYIDNDALVTVMQVSSGIHFVHYALEPDRLSVDSYQGKFYSVLKVNGTLANEEGTIIHQFEKVIPLEFTQEQIDQIQNRPFSIRDMFPLIPGKYKFSLLLKNELSKEFTSLERNILVPEKKGDIRMSPLLLGYRMIRNPYDPSRLRPFQWGEYQLYFQPNRVFLKKNDLVVTFQIYGLQSVLKDNVQIRFVLTKGDQEYKVVTRHLRDYQDIPNILERIPLKDFPAAHFRLKVMISVDGREAGFALEEFDVTYAENLARPWIYSNILPGWDDPVYAYILGVQQFNNGNWDKARPLVEQAYQAKPEDPEIALSLARIFLRLREYHEIPPILLSHIDNSEPPKFELLYILGKAYQFIGELDKAIEIFDKAISEHGLSTNLLNALGECYLQSGNPQQALASWIKSLEINKDQPEIKKNIKDLKEKK